MAITLLENKYYTVEFLKEKLGCSYDGILNLCEKKRVINWDSSKHTLAFQFVGFLFHNNLSIIFLPKYLKNEDIVNQKEYTALLIEVLHKYQKSLLDTAYDSEPLEEIDDQQFHMLGTISYLLQQYSDYGLYIKEHEVQDTLFDGEIDWDMTLNTSTTYLTADNRPVYLDLINTYSETDMDAKITDLHKFILNQCSKFMEIHHLDLIFSWPQVFFETVYDWESNTDEALYIIEKEMLIEFQDQKLRLLHSLKFFIELIQSMKFDEESFMIGTKYFYHVWEKCCADVLGHDPSIQRSITKPLWSIGKEILYSDKTLKPDFLRTYPFKDLNLLLIFDAKYYTLSYDSSVSNLMNSAPGVGDLTKQYMYQKALDKYVQANNVNAIYNAFLLPAAEGPIIQAKGTVQFDFIDTLPPIQIVYLNAENLFSNYINDNPWTNETFNNLIEELNNTK